MDKPFGNPCWIVFFLFSLVLMRTQWKCASYFKLLWGIQRCRGKTWIVPLKHVKRSWIYSFFCSFIDSLVHCPEANRHASCCIFEYFPFFPFPEFNNTMKPPSRLVRFAGFVKTCSQIKDKKKRKKERERIEWPLCITTLNNSNSSIITCHDIFIFIWRRCLTK